MSQARHQVFRLVMSGAELLLDGDLIRHISEEQPSKGCIPVQSTMANQVCRRGQRRRTGVAPAARTASPSSSPWPTGMSTWVASVQRRGACGQGCIRERLTMANKYVDMGGVGAKVCSMRPPPADCADTSCVLDNAASPEGAVRSSWKGACTFSKCDVV